MPVMEPPTGGTPQVSVIIPACNVHPFIGAALESLLAQSFRDFEIILVNDGSPDTPALREAIAPYLDGLHYLERANGGPGAARNTGLHAARGEYVAFLDGDDYWAPEFLAKQVRFLAARPDTVLVYSDVWYFGDTPLAGQTYLQHVPCNGNPTVEALLGGECIPATTAVLARSNAVTQAGMFDESFRYCEDLDLWLRLVRVGKIACLQEPLAYHRIHPSSLSARGDGLLKGGLLVCRKHLATGELSLREVAAARLRIRYLKAQLRIRRGKLSLAGGDLAMARHLLARAVNDSVSTPWKLRAALLALRFAPGLVHRLYKWRERRHPRWSVS
jgi:GT2 family glycosyltransferase